MEEKVVDMKEFKKEAKKRERKANFEKKLNDLAVWYEKNEKFAIFAVPIIITIVTAAVKGGTTITKKAMVNHRIMKEQYWKNTHYYDHSAGHWWELRRELTNKEWQHFQLRKEAGESTLDIFSSMGVLK